MAQRRSSSGVTAFLAFSCFSAFLGAVCFGWSTGVINNPKASIVRLINESTAAHYGVQLTAYTADVLFSVVVSMFAVGGMIGALVSGYWAERLGRRNGMLVNSGVGVVAALLMSLAKPAGSFEMLIVGRLLIGFCSALYTGLVPIYLAEIAPRQLRGGIGVLNQLGVVTGLLLSQALSIQQALGGPQLWPILFAIAGLPSILQLACLPACLETPRHLLLTRHDEAAARSALCQLRGVDKGDSEDKSIDEELAEIRSELDGQTGQEQRQGCSRLAAQWRPLIVGIVLHLSQQWSGINVIFYYSADLFQGVGASESAAQLATIAVGAIMVVMTLVSVPLMDRAGRRTLHLAGLAGITVASALFTVLFSVGQQQKVDGAVPAGLAGGSIASALLVVVFFAIGPGSIPWMMMSEMFPQDSRSAANAVGVLVNWLANFAVGMLFPVLLDGLGSLVFVPFTVLTAAFLALLFLRMPETKGRTIDQIVASFSRHGDRGRGSVSPENAEPASEATVILGTTGLNSGRPGSCGSYT
ncbi:hypothetical protein BOX15_Mlig030902g1 [Macrostomum lignano]|uniref:Major facilitator superfamily (MFS) profile domain-containing protein n=1 Tax=Macrostomum lignano TaxID=282301 RepID=A0A267FNR2_9PLAT|nr:hypothetical protein BOX15_Mlig030902g1 [Macrostomum lignano]